MLEDAKLADEEENTAKRSWGTSINIDGANYATSLFWQPLQNASDPFQEVEEASEGVLEGADLFCIKGGKAPQFGICVSQEGYHSGEQVAAVSLATAMSNVGSYVAVFQTKEGWWYTCIRNDIILSDGDMLFLNEDEAKNQFMSMLAVPDWGKKIAPKEWGIEDTEEADLNEIIARGARAKLQKIKALRGTKLLMVVAISLIVGLWLVSSLINHIFMTPQVRPITVPVKPKAVQKQELPPEIKPWETLENPKIKMRECYEKIVSLVKIMPPGWSIEPLTCKEGVVTTQWKRNIGRLSWAKTALDKSKLKFGGRSFSADGNTLSASLPLGKIEKMKSPPAKHMVDMVNELNDTYQAIGQPITLSASSFKSPRGTLYRILNFNLSSKYNPITWTEMLTKYSGVEIKLIRYNPADETWYYEGTIYVM